MVSRANLSGRKPYGGVLGQVYKGPANPAQDPSRVGVRRGKRNITEAAGDAVTGQEPGGPAGRMQRKAAVKGRQSLTGQKPRPPRDMGAGPIDEGGVPVPTTPRRGAQPRRTLYEPSPSQITPPGQEPRQRSGFAGVGDYLRERETDRAAAAEKLRAEKYPTTSPGIGETAYRPGYTPPVETPRRGGVAGMFQEAQRRQREAAAPPVDRSQVGIRESLGEAYVDPREAAEHARRGFAEQPMTGGTTTEQPTRRLPRSPRSRSRRNIRR